MHEAFNWLATPTRPAQSRAALFTNWELRDFFQGGVLAATVLKKGCEVHLVVNPELRGRVLYKQVLRQSLRELLEENDGMLTTRLLHASSRARRFVERLGFKHTWSDDLFCYFALTAPPFQRDAL